MNNTLKLLEYRPSPDANGDGTTGDIYHYDGSNPETLEVRLIPELESTTHEWDIDIRVLDVNNWPELDGSADLGDPSNNDGPADQTGANEADPSVEKVIPGSYSVTDGDNDEITDGNGNNDPDGNDGTGDDMVLIGYLDCGADAPAADHGFHFSSANYESAGTTIDSALNFALGLGNPNPAAAGRSG